MDPFREALSVYSLLGQVNSETGSAGAAREVSARWGKRQEALDRIRVSPTTIAHIYAQLRESLVWPGCEATVLAAIAGLPHG